MRKVTTESCATPRAGGKDFRSQEEACDLRVAPVYPETAGLEDHLVRIKKLVEAYQPQRLVVDSLNALDGISSLRGFKEFVIALMAHLREEGIAVLVTANSPSLVGGRIRHRGPELQHD